MEQKSKKRGKNFTSREKDLLLDCIVPHVKVIECLETNKKSCADKEEAWESIEAAFNSQSESPRDAKSLKTFYAAFKMKAKKENAHYRRQRFETGGGSGPKELDPATQKMLAIIQNQVTPLVNAYDSGAPFHNTVQLETSDIPVVEDVTSGEAGFEVVGVVAEGVEIGLVDEIVQIEETEQRDESAQIEDSVDIHSKDSPPQAGTNSMKKKGVSSKFPSAKKRKMTCEEDELVVSKRTRFEEKARIEDELAIFKLENLKKQSRLLDLQLETAAVQKEAALIELQIKQKALQGCVM